MDRGREQGGRRGVWLALLSMALVTTQVIDALLGFIAANPARSEEWKAQADSKMAMNDEVQP